MNTPISNARVNILLVDDRPENILALETTLAPLEHNLVSVNSGKDALREVLQRDFAVIILDVLMPGMDGYETANLIKAREKSQYVPIIFVTASGDEEIRSYEVGAIDYIAIPYNPDILRAKVRAFVELYKTRQELAISKREVEMARDKLELRVKERTASLAKEIEQRIKTDKALLASENKFRSIFETSNDAIMLFGEDRFLDCNDKTLEIFGFSTKEEFTRVHPADISPPVQPNEVDSLSAANEKIETALSQGVNHFEWMHRRRNGEDFPADVLLSAFEFEGKKILQATVRDITERKLAEQKLKASEHKFTLFFMEAPIALGVFRNDGVISHINNRFTELFGYDSENIPTIREGWKLAFPDDTYRKWVEDSWSAAVAKAAKEGTAIESIEYKVTCRNGEERNVLIGGSIIEDGVLATFIDVTERRKWEKTLIETNHKLQKALDEINNTQKMLIRSEKLAGLGQIAAGVAHELKNPLNIIYTSSQLMSMNDQADDEVKDSCKTIGEQVMRAVKIIDNLRDFARERKPEIKEVDLHPFIEKTLNLVAYEMKSEGIEIAREFFPKPVYIMGDDDQLAQVFLNIVNNARDSMKIKKKSSSYEEAEKYGWWAKLIVRTVVEEGRVKISFIDNGIGIKDENKKNMFTPFFTTKGETTGTGLGAAIGLSIIENHGGTIEFESEEGKGAEFTVTIPLAQVRYSSASPPGSSFPPSTPDRRRQGP